MMRCLNYMRLVKQLTGNISIYDKKLLDGYIRAVDIMYNIESTEKLKPFSFYTMKN